MRLLPLLLATVFTLPLQALAQEINQGEPTPGMHSLEMMTDDDAAAMYRLKNGDKPKSETDDTATPTINPVSNGAASAPETTSDANLTPKTLVIIPDEPVAKDKDSAVERPSGSTRGSTNEKMDSRVEPEDRNTDDALSKANLWPRAKLSAWTNGYVIGIANTPDQITKALQVFEADQDRANPQDLMDVAELYASQKDMQKAARYYYAAQLRHAFDTKRFPIKPTRTIQGDSLATMIGAWAAQSSDRMSTVIADVQQWDQKTGYHYRPNFPLPDAQQNLGVPSENDWPEILTQTRQAYFKDLGDIASALKRMGK